MRNEPVLSTLFTRLSSRISQIREDIRLIEREYKMLDLEKIVPVHEYTMAFLMPYAVIPTRETYTQMEYARCQQSIINRTAKQVRNKTINCYMGDTDILTAESEQLLKVLMTYETNNAAPYTTIPFFHLGDLITATIKTTKDNDFWLTTRISASFGGGETDLRIWQNINGIKDYSRHFHDDRPTRRRKKREHKAGVLKWKPKFA